jgi:hypothetical protein
MVHVKLPGEHATPGFRVSPDMGSHHLLNQLGVYQFSHPDTGPGGVVGNEGQAPFALTHLLIDQQFRGTYPHKPTHNEGRPLENPVDGIRQGSVFLSFDGSNQMSSQTAGKR